jgi:hypothetical protein
MTYVHVLYISLCSTTKKLAGSVDHKHNPLQLPITQQVEGDVTSEDLNNLVMKITTELFFLDYFAVPFRDFHPETLQGFVCLSILVKCLNLDSMIGQLM